MKLRNKKTGQVGTFIISKDHFKCVDLGCVPFYFSLSGLLAEWADVEDINVPSMPFIKDEKIRKAVRAWAEANELLIFKVVNEHFNCSKIIGYGDHNIGSRIGFKTTIAHANKDQLYSIAELCGEEE